MGQILAPSVWRRSESQGTLVVAYSLAAAAGGALTASVLWLASGIPTSIPAGPRAVFVAVFALIVIARDVGLIHLRLPQNARLVPREVFWRGPLRGAITFGFEMGTGVRTYVSAGTPYVLAAILFLGGIPFTSALLAGVAFGLGRGGALGVRLVARSEAAAFECSLDRDLRWAAPVATAALGVVGSLFLFAP